MGWHNYGYGGGGSIHTIVQPPVQETPSSIIKPPDVTTTPIVIGTPDEIKITKETLEDANERLQRRPACAAALHGPLGSAESAINNSTWRAVSLGSGNGRTFAGAAVAQKAASS